MAESSEGEVRGLNALGNPERKMRTGADRGPDGEGRIGNKLPGGILARGTASSARKGMEIERAESRMRSGGR